MNKDGNVSVKLLQKQSTLQRAVSNFFIQRLYSLVPELINVAITRVELTPDLALLKVFLHASVNNGVEGKEFIHQVVGKLIPHVNFLKKEIAKAVILRRVPNVRFYYDQVCEKSMYIERLIDSVDKEDKD